MAKIVQPTIITDRQTVGSLLSLIDSSRTGYWSYSNDDIINLAPRAFAGAKYLKTIKMGSVETAQSDCFIDCYNLESISLPKLREASATILSNSPKIKIISLPSLKTVIAGYYKESFFNLSSLETIDLPSLETVGGGFINFCYKLKNMNVPNLKTITDTSYSNRYFINFPSKIAPDSEWSLSFPSLVSCDKMSFIIGATMSNLDIPLLKTCYNDLTYNCDYLKKIYAPSLESCGGIGGGSICEEIILPSIKSIGNTHKIGIFNYGDKLSKVVIGTNDSASVCSVTMASGGYNSDLFYPDKDKALASPNLFIYVADSLVSQYKTASYWSVYADKIKGISEIPS